MTDISTLPTRLREHAFLHNWNSHSSIEEHIAYEAAAEIERLQAENAATAADIESQVAASSKLATELEELRKANEWRPIETAPKDGTLILGFGPYNQDAGFYVQVFGYFHSDWTIIWMHGHGRPTHWMPLPQPPKPESGA